MYKSLTLAALLVPFFGYGVSKETCVNELEQAYFNKSEELRGIAKKIYKQCQQSREVVADYFSCLDHFINSYKKENPSMQEEEIRDLLLKENYRMFDEVQDAFEGKKKLTTSIVDALMYHADKDGNSDFNTSRFFEIDAVASSYYVFMLLKKYEVCLKELLAMNDQLRELKK